MKKSKASKVAHFLTMLTFVMTILSIRKLVLPAIASEIDFEFLILHTGSILGNFGETTDSKGGDPVGGCARIAYVLEETKKDYYEGRGPPSLYLDAGDVFGCSDWIIVHRKKIAIEVMNALGPDAMCLGVHEFDYGVTGLLPFIKSVNFPVVMSNVRCNKETRFEALRKESFVLELNGRKIGIVGYFTTWKKMYNYRISSLEFVNEVDAIIQVSEQLRRDGVDIIIALGHSGIETDMQVAKRATEVDIIVGGMSKTFLWNGSPPDKEVPVGSYPTVVRRRDGTRVPIVHAYKNAKYLGRLFVSFDKNGNLVRFKGNPVFLSHRVRENSNLLHILEKYRPAIDTANKTAVAKSRVVLDGTSCRFNECNLGNLIADSFVTYRAKRYKGRYWTDAAIALVNAGAIRASIDPKSRSHVIYQLDVMKAMPFNNSLYTVELDGRNLRSSLEYGVGMAARSDRAEFLMVSGLKIVYDFAKPSQHRVESIKVRCAECTIPKYGKLEDKTMYKVVTSEYLVKGGDGHDLIRSQAAQVIALDGVDMDAIVDYFKMHKVIIQSVDRRIVVKNPISHGVQSHSKFSVLVITLALIVWPIINTE